MTSRGLIMSPMPDHDAELAALVGMLTEVGTVEEFTDDDGRVSLRLTARGAQMGRALAMARDDADPEAVLTALLEHRT